MVVQYIIIGIVIVACLVYATIIMWKNGKSQLKCGDYKCAGCPFYEKCEKNKKKLGKNLVEPNKSSTFAIANEKYNISIYKVS
nr:FeoB-associated Cys-rich membrane protein [uncultured Prevotella sp.]